MRAAALCMLTAALMWSAAGNLPPPERYYKILVLFPVASISHRNILMAVAEALADRGHKVRLNGFLQQCDNDLFIILSFTCLHDTTLTPTGCGAWQLPGVIEAR